MANTAKLNLPLIDDNMVADVPRDVNAIATGIDAKAGAANGLATLGADGKVPAAQLSVSQPPDASTTTKGIVQLNNTVTSTSTTQAATANAVKTAHDRANAAYSLADAATTQAEAQAMANTAETNAKNASLPRTGGHITAEGPALGLVGTSHLYMEYFPKGIAAGRKAYTGFGDGASADFYIQCSGGNVVISDKSGITSIADLKSSVANGKQAIATAISGKGIAASGSDEFAVLASKISQINVGKSFASGTFNGSSSTTTQIRNLSFDPTTVVIHSFNSAGGTMIIRSDISGSIFNATARNQTPGWFNNSAVTLVSRGFDVSIGVSGLFYWFALNTN